MQTEVVSELEDFDPENKFAYVLRINGVAYRAGVVKNTSESYDWDIPGLMSYLRRRGFWTQVSTRMLDFTKLNSEIAHGNISKTELKKFMIPKPKRDSYIRFDLDKNRGEHSGGHVIEKGRGKGQKTS